MKTDIIKETVKSFRDVYMTEDRVKRLIEYQKQSLAKRLKEIGLIPKRCYCKTTFPKRKCQYCVISDKLGLSEDVKNV